MIALIEAKQLRLLASAVDRRWPNYPDVPTLKEQGYNAATVVPLGFACPAGVPAEIRARLEQAVARAARDAELAETLRSLTIAPHAMTGKEFHDAIRSQAAAVEAALVEAGMKKT